MDERSLILDRATNLYLKSGNFNGLSLKDILIDLKLDLSALKDTVTSLVHEEKATLVFGGNPHIKAFTAEDTEKQIERLQASNLDQVCLYPSPSHLKSVVDPNLYKDSPFTLRLAFGEPQLSFESFDLSVLEYYRNDPRYYYDNDDINGYISVRDEHYKSGSMSSSDQILLQSFGFAYDSNMNRAVAVFLRYLADLSPQHQQMWNAKLLEGDYKLHPDYFKPSMLGEFPDGISIFDALIQEQHHINEMCKLMGRPPLFRDEYVDGKKPRGFSFLIRPTSREFNDFILLLDKLISDNINKSFFMKDVEFEYDEIRPSDGKVVAIQKGTIRILEEWLNKMWKVVDRKPIEETISAFKKVRKLRQNPAHSIKEDSFHQKYFKEQREIMIKAYTGIRTLRLLFANHPKVKGYKVPDWLQTGEIWTY